MNPMIPAIAGEAIGQGLGILNMDQQVNAQKDLGKFNQGLAIDTWEKTNYPAQRRQMEKAGLNVGLMYGSAGQGGTTQGGSAGNSVTPIHTGMGMQAGMQMQQTKAQIDLLKAETAKTQAETPKVGAEQKNIETQTTATAQNVENAKIQSAILEFEKSIKEQQARILQETGNDQIATIRATMDEAISKANIKKNEGIIKDATLQEEIKQIKQTTIEQAIRMKAMRENINLTQQQEEAIKQTIQKVQTEIQMMYTGKEQEWQKLSLQARQTAVQEIMARNNTTQTDSNTMKAWAGMITEMASLGLKK
ncbi:MAG: DNA pilot protein [Microviridae sp.]|nr:MAG: DNA pilot protein [Microviridae sp.]